MILGIGLASTTALALIFLRGDLVNPPNGTESGHNNEVNHERVLVSVSASVGPKNFVFVDRPITLTIQVTNPGLEPLRNVIVHLPLAKELEFKEATHLGMAIIKSSESSQRGVMWKLSDLEPGKSEVFSVTAKPTVKAKELVANARVTADDNIEETAGARFEVRGMPAMRLEVKDTIDPVRVAEETSYIIQIRSEGSEDLHQLGVKALVPDELQILEVSADSKPEIDGQTIVFPILAELKIGKAVQYVIRAKALKSGIVRIRTEVYVEEFGQQPIEEGETTTIIDTKP
jgi:hypothetical protein